MQNKTLASRTYEEFFFKSKIVLIKIEITTNSKLQFAGWEWSVQVKTETQDNNEKQLCGLMMTFRRV